MTLYAQLLNSLSAYYLLGKSVSGNIYRYAAGDQGGGLIAIQMGLDVVSYGKGRVIYEYGGKAGQTIGNVSGYNFNFWINYALNNRNSNGTQTDQSTTSVNQQSESQSSTTQSSSTDQASVTSENQSIRITNEWIQTQQIQQQDANQANQQVIQINAEQGGGFIIQPSGGAGVFSSGFSNNSIGNTTGSFPSAFGTVSVNGQVVGSTNSLGQTTPFSPGGYQGPVAFPWIAY